MDLSALLKFVMYLHDWLNEYQFQRNGYDYHRFKYHKIGPLCQQRTAQNLRSHSQNYLNPFLGLIKIFI